MESNCHGCHLFNQQSPATWLRSPWFAAFVVSLWVAALAQAAAEAPAQPARGVHEEMTATAKAAVPELKTKEPSKWSFMLEPYGWMMGLDGTVGVKGFESSVDLRFRDILKHLDWGIFLAGEVHYGRWGIIADGFFAALSASGNPPGPLYDNATIKLQQGMVEVALAYRVWQDRRGFLDIFAGARYNYLGLEVSGQIDNAGVEQVGTNVTRRISERLDSAAEEIISQKVDGVKDDLARALQQVAGRVSRKINALENQLVREIEKGVDRDITKVKELEAELAQTIRDRADAGVQEFDALKSGIAQGIRERLAAILLERRVLLPEDVRRAADRRDLVRALNPARDEFVELARAVAERQIALARADVANNLKGKTVILAEQRLAAAKKQLDQALERDAEIAKEVARARVAAAKAQLARARANAAEVAQADIQNLNKKVSNAQKKLSKALAKNIEDALPTSGSGDEHWVDPFVGLRAQINITRWLFVAARGDVGGFGLASHITWQAIGSVGVNFTRSIFVELGYRYLFTDYTNGGFTYDVAESGMFMGLGVKF